MAQASERLERARKDQFVMDKNLPDGVTPSHSDCFSSIVFEEDHVDLQRGWGRAFLLWSSLSGPEMSSGSEGKRWWAQCMGQQHGPSCPGDAFEQQLP